jgi:hypothetical protein
MSHGKGKGTAKRPATVASPQTGPQSTPSSPAPASTPSPVAPQVAMQPMTSSSVRARREELLLCVREAERLKNGGWIADLGHQLDRLAEQMRALGMLAEACDALAVALRLRCALYPPGHATTALCERRYAEALRAAGRQIPAELSARAGAMDAAALELGRAGRYNCLLAAEPPAKLGLCIPMVENPPRSRIEWAAMVQSAEGQTYGIMQQR